MEGNEMTESSSNEVSLTPRELAAGLVFNWMGTGSYRLTIECNFCPVKYYQGDGTPEYDWLEDAAKHIVAKHLGRAREEAKT